jgi:hypothetical protein
MKMNMFPLALLSMPNSRFFHRRRNRLAFVEPLRQANIGDDGNVTHDANVGRHDCGLDWG